MSVEITCWKCGKGVGISGPYLGGETETSGPCPGYDNHQEEIRTTRNRVFGLIRETTCEYPETITRETSIEYIGPEHKFFLWLAAVFGTSSENLYLYVNGEQVCTSLLIFPYGKGVDKFSDYKRA